MDIPKIVWKNFKIQNRLFVLGRGDIFIVDNINKYNVQIDQVIEVSNQKYLITGIDRLSNLSPTIALICKQIYNDTSSK